MLLVLVLYKDEGLDIQRLFNQISNQHISLSQAKEFFLQKNANGVDKEMTGNTTALRLFARNKEMAEKTTNVSRNQKNANGVDKEMTGNTTTLRFFATNKEMAENTTNISRNFAKTGKHVIIYGHCLNIQPDGSVDPALRQKNKNTFDILTNKRKQLSGLCKVENTSYEEVLYNGLCLGSSCECVGRKRNRDENKWPPEDKRCFADNFDTAPFARYNDAPKVTDPGAHEIDKNFCFKNGFKGHGIRDVSIGRQLFTDNFLIRYMSPKIKRVYNTAKWAKTVPLGGHIGEVGGSIVWDKHTKHYRLYLRPHLSYMSSPNGLDWSKAKLTDLRIGQRDAMSVWLDPFEKDKKKRFKAMTFTWVGGHRLLHYISPDGITFKPYLEKVGGFFQDASTVNLNPFRRKWLYFIKANYMTQVRTTLYHEVDVQKFGILNFGPGYCPFTMTGGYLFDMKPYRTWKSLGCLLEPPGNTYQPNRFQSPVFMCADSADKNFDNTYLDYYGKKDYYVPKRLTDIYYSVAFAYESIMISLFPVHSKWNSKAPKDFFPHLGWSRDGFHYSRVPPEQGQTKRPESGYIDLSSIPSTLTKKYKFVEWKPLGNSFVVEGDLMYSYIFHYGLESTYNETWDRLRTERYYDFLVPFLSIFKFRRDGLVHLESNDLKQLVVTEILTVKTAKYLFINANASSGSVRIKIDWVNGSTFKPWSRMFSSDDTRHLVQWPVPLDSTLDLLQGQKFVLHFELSMCALYSFWFSNNESGASGGFVQSSSEVDATSLPKV